MNKPLNIQGLIKLTTVDYPNRLAAIIFVGGCNFACPYCHNHSLIDAFNHPKISEEAVLELLNARKGILEGLVISGGEAILDSALPQFLHKVRGGLSNIKIKLDTNGTNPKKLEELIKNRLLDFVAMDIKNSPAKYDLTAGARVDLNLIKQSISVLKQAKKDYGIKYQFRTTLVKEYHQKSDIEEMIKLIGEEERARFVLQKYKHSDGVNKKIALSEFIV